MTIQEFKKKHKAVLIELKDEPTRLVIKHNKKVIIIRYYDFFFRQEYVVIVQDNENYEYTFNSLSDVDFSLDMIVDKSDNTTGD
jgi:hypothetical protein